MSTATRARRSTIRSGSKQVPTNMVDMLLKLSQITDDLLEELAELKPEVVASLKKADRDIKRGKFREITSLSEHGA